VSWMGTGDQIDKAGDERNEWSRVDKLMKWKEAESSKPTDPDGGKRAKLYQQAGDSELGGLGCGSCFSISQVGFANWKFRTHLVVN